MQKNSVTSAVLIGSFLLLVGCTAHKVDTAPSLTVDDLHISYLPPSNAAPWHENFHDPLLSALIGEMLAQNLDLGQARQRVHQARALSAQSDALRFPTVELGAALNRSWADGKRERSSTGVGGLLGWDADIFDRLGANAKADELLGFVREAQMEALRQTLGAECAKAYFGAIASKETLALLQKQIDVDRQFLELVELRNKNGISALSEVLAQKSKLAQSQSLMPQVEAQIEAYENRLDLLLGKLPDHKARVFTKGDHASLKPIAPDGYDMRSLIQSPGLRAAYYALIRADAQIASAVADRLPSLRISGSFFSGSVATLSASLMEPLLDWGRRKAAVEENKALYEEQLGFFASSYLGAAEEVQNTLDGEHRQQEYIKRLKAQAAILEESLEQAKALYIEGVNDYLLVLNALSDLQHVQRALIEAEFTLIQLHIRFYEATGVPVGFEDKGKK